MLTGHSHYLDAQRFRPSTSRVKVIWERLNPSARAERYRAARECEQRVLEVQRRMGTGVHESVAVQQVAQPVHRSTYRNWARRYAQFGMEGLVDCRLPKPPETVQEDIQQMICNLRRADPDMSVEAIISFVSSHHRRRVSESSVKRILKRSGLHRGRGNPRLGNALRGKSLALGGMKLIEAAAVSTGYLEALTKTVVEHVASLPVPEGALGPDLSGRDEHGRFLPSYNERYCKSDEDIVGPGFASVELKRELKDPSLFHVRGASSAVVERKLWALMCSPVIGTGRWDGMRTPRGKLLEELCGFAYMPSTLSLFTTELKYAGVAAPLWETHAATWHSETQTWGSPRHAAVLYVDGTAKPIFTNMFSQSTRVSLFNRTMPGLDVVGFHTGYGIPLWYLAHSGRAPLVKAVPQAIKSLEAQLGAEIGRIVVIDAEGNSAPFLAGLEQEGRGWVTRLRPSMVSNKEVLNWTAFRSYRDHDRIREGELELRLDKRNVLRVRLLEIERSERKELVHLAASKLLHLRDWKTDEVADLYFSRWPNQELNFRAVNQATGFKQVRGYGKRLVDNVAVTTRGEQLRQLIVRHEASHQARQSRLDKLTAEHDAHHREMTAIQQSKKAVDNALDRHFAQPDADVDALRALYRERKTIEATLAKSDQKSDKLEHRIEKSQTLVDRTTARLQGYRDESQHIQENIQILKHDVELDSIFNVFKVGFTLLITYILRTMLDNSRMNPVTFLERIATLPARQYFTDDYEYITFEYNARDPNTMALLIASCQSINARRLPMRSGRILQIAVEQPPNVDLKGSTDPG